MKPGAKVVVIEDLVSTGGSSLSAVEALQKAGCEVLGMVAIFTYGFPAAEKNFAEAGVRLDTLSNYNTMIEMAIEQGYVHADRAGNAQRVEARTGFVEKIIRIPQPFVRCPVRFAQ